jgi:hypothetical protein
LLLLSPLARLSVKSSPVLPGVALSSTTTTWLMAALPVLVTV